MKAGMFVMERKINVKKFWMSKKGKFVNSHRFLFKKFEN